jgi:hypothetical protein
MAEAVHRRRKTHSSKPAAAPVPETPTPPQPIETKKVIFEFQGPAVPPCNTYINLTAEFNPTSGQKRIIMDLWPRQRMSQKWTRGGGLNPERMTVNFTEFAQGALKEKVTELCGKRVYENLKASIQSYLL